MRKAAILGAMLPVVLCGQVDPSALLQQARAKIVESVEKLPKYTCVQTVHRSRFEVFYGRKASGCGHVEEAGTVKGGPLVMLAWRDQFKLDVTVSSGREIFSWAGAQVFQSADVQEIVGGGLTGTGDFGPFLMDVFGGKGSVYQYVGSEPEHGRVYAVYHYHVPVPASHYQIKVGARPEDLATLAYEGQFWIDPQSAELSRMTIAVPKPVQRERPMMRTADGQMVETVRQKSQIEAVEGSKGRSGEQYMAWEAVYGPVGEDGYPEPLWDKLTGKINHNVALYMRDHGYDLSWYVRSNWAKLGPQLKRKLHLYCGDMDNYGLNLAVYLFEDFMKTTDAGATFEYGRPMKGHGWQPMTNAELVKMMAAEMAK